MVGWAANALILVSWWLVGSRHRHGLLPGVAGSVLWAWVGAATGQYDLAFIEVVLAALGARAWFLWEKPS
jgi:hypothetical protein